MAKKYRGQVRMTLEKLHEILGLPSEVQLSDVVYNPTRETVSFKLQSDEVVQHLTYETGEGMEIPHVNMGYYLEHKDDKNEEEN